MRRKAWSLQQTSRRVPACFCYEYIEKAGLAVNASDIDALTSRFKSGVSETELVTDAFIVSY
ncbi:MAG: hypothetical protein NWE94_08025 [Candidatus Bathyarchaeota archaeon]|nr:hypothetical protein [Candidatus Bathyarchaeota archaeon]